MLLWLVIKIADKILVDKILIFGRRVQLIIFKEDLDNFMSLMNFSFLKFDFFDFVVEIVNDDVLKLVF